MKIKIDENLEILECGDDFRDFVQDPESTSLAANLHPLDYRQVTEALDALEGELFAAPSEYGNLIREVPGEILQGREDSFFGCRIAARDGNWRWFGGHAVRDKDSLGFPAIRVELSDMEELLSGRRGGGREKADEDALMDLAGIEEYAGKKCAERGGHPVTIGIANIDHFHEAVRTRGTSGEEIVQTVAEIIGDALGPMGRQGRLSTDELMFVIDRAKDKSETRNILRYIRDHVEQEFADEQGNSTITISIGAATASEYASGYEDLFTLADKMLYRAKEKGRNRYIIYSPEIHGDVLHSWIRDAAKTTMEVEVKDSTALVLQMLDGYLHTQAWAVGAGLRPVCRVYGLDGAYLFYKNLQKSMHGYRRGEDSTLPASAGDGDCTEEMPFALEEGFASLFDDNGVLPVREVSEYRETCPGLYDYMMARGYRHGFLYLFRDVPERGLIAFFDKKPEDERMTEQRERDLTYISKILEIAIATR